MFARRVRTLIARCALPALVCLAVSSGRAGAEPRTLADSTWVDRWRLRNGMQVNVRHVPGCNAVAVVAAYRIGRNQDPPDHAGLADLVSEVLYTAAAGEVPDRTRADMADLRPLGWNMQVTPRFTLLSEVASVAQFPGVLRQVAARVAGVTVTDSLLGAARRTLLAEKGRTYAGSPDLTLFSQMRDLALGVSDEELIARLAGRTLRDVTVAEVDERLRRLYVPANAVLALAGNLDGLDVRTLVRNLFEGIPGGAAGPEPPLRPLKAVGRAVRRPTLALPIGGAGIIAPAITDPKHPDFYLNSLAIARFCEEFWGAPEPPLTFRFRYPLLADAEIAQFFPPVAADETDADQVGIAMQDAIGKLSMMVVDHKALDQLRADNQWIFGGTFTPAFKQRMRQHSGTLHTLASTLAVRALWGDDDFWARYLARFVSPEITSVGYWTSYFESPDRIVRLLFTPAKP